MQVTGDPLGTVSLYEGEMTVCSSYYVFLEWDAGEEESACLSSLVTVIMWDSWKDLCLNLLP